MDSDLVKYKLSKVINSINDSKHVNKFIFFKLINPHSSRNFYRCFIRWFFLPIWGQEVKFLGELFINALLMLVVPLVITSMIASITSLGDISKLKGIGLKTIILFYNHWNSCNFRLSFS